VGTTNYSPSSFPRKREPSVVTAHAGNVSTAND
jgi:hypothetical protein